MPIVESKIRNSSPLFVIVPFIFSGIVLWFDRGFFIKVTDIRDIPSMILHIFLQCLSIILSSIISRLLLIFIHEYFVSGDSKSILSQLKNHLEINLYLLACFCCSIPFWLPEPKFDFGDFISIIAAGVFLSCFDIFLGYDDADLASSQNMNKSIGANWAYGAYSAFYSKILKDITRRMSQFEEEEKINLLVKKLVIICPHSCNANGSLEGKDGEMKVIGNLESIIDDEGANNDRTLKTNVYKIQGAYETYIAAEIPSPLAILYESRDEMDDVILQYHRDCFIEHLKRYLKSYPCIILEYDDLNSTEPLHSFLLSQLGEKKLANGTN